MGAFLSYAIGSGLVLLALFLVFRLFLTADNQHGYNRGIILAIYAISFLALPVMHLLPHLHHMDHKPISTGALSELTTIVTSVGISQYHAPLWGTILIWIFIAGMLVMTVKTVISWIQILKVVRSGEKIQKEGYTLVLTDDELLSPFSWMRYVVISRKDYEQNSQTILDHEKGHICLYHWIDLLVAQAVIIINWFNPAAWLMREELMLIHEYQADIKVLTSGHNAKEYQMLLIKKAVGARLPSLANSLNHSKLKKRITMMYKEKSSKRAKLKALALVPALAAALAATSIPQVKAAMSTIASSVTSLSEVTDNSVNSQNGVSIAVAPQVLSEEAQIMTEQAVIMTSEDVETLGSEAKEKPNTWEDVKVIGVGAVRKADAPSDNTTNNTTTTKNSKKIRYILDGREVSEEEVNKINPIEIENISVYKEEDTRLIIDLRQKAANRPAPQVFVDGKEMTDEEFSQTYTPEDIENIAEDRSENKIYVTLKKK